MSIPTDYPQDSLSDDTCCWCGRPLRDSRPGGPNKHALLHLIRGGTEWAQWGDTEEEDADCGYWPVGSECVKKAAALDIEVMPG